MPKDGIKDTAKRTGEGREKKNRVLQFIDKGLPMEREKGGGVKGKKVFWGEKGKKWSSFNPFQNWNPRDWQREESAKGKEGKPCRQRDLPGKGLGKKDS